jgi:hypothetical protein
MPTVIGRPARQPSYSLKLKELEAIDWISLSRSLDIVSLRILDRVYSEGGQVLDFMCRAVHGLNVSKMTVYRRAVALEKKRLVELVGRKPISICPIYEIEANVRRLVALGYERLLPK